MGAGSEPGTRMEPGESQPGSRAAQSARTRGAEVRAAKKEQRREARAQLSFPLEAFV